MIEQCWCSSCSIDPGSIRTEAAGRTWEHWGGGKIKAHREGEKWSDWWGGIAQTVPKYLPERKSEPDFQTKQPQVHLQKKLLQKINQSFSFFKGFYITPLHIPYLFTSIPEGIRIILKKKNLFFMFCCSKQMWNIRKTNPQKLKEAQQAKQPTKWKI